MTALPPTDNYLRIVKGAAIFDAHLNKVDSAVFRPRPEDKDTGLSGNWVEYFNLLTKLQAVEAIWAVHKAKGRSISNTYRLAELNVGDTCAHVLEGIAREISFRHHPELKSAGHDFDDPSHSGIHGYAPDDYIIAELISQNVTALYAPPPKETPKPQKSAKSDKM